MYCLLLLGHHPQANLPTLQVFCERIWSRVRSHATRTQFRVSRTFRHTSCTSNILSMTELTL